MALSSDPPSNNAGDMERQAEDERRETSSPSGLPTNYCSQLSPKLNKSVLEQDADVLGISSEELAFRRGMPHPPTPTVVESPQEVKAWRGPGEANADSNKKSQANGNTSTKNSEKQIQPPKHLRNASVLLSLAVAVGSCNGVMGYLTSKKSIELKLFAEQRALKQAKEEKQAATERNQILKALPREVLERQEKYIACSKAGRRSDSEWMKYCLSGKL
jgi:hypothetical protein